MNRLQVRYSTLGDAFTLFGVLFYTQVISFFLRLGNVSVLDDAQQVWKATSPIRFAGC